MSLLLLFRISAAKGHLSAKESGSDTASITGIVWPLNINYKQLSINVSDRLAIDITTDVLRIDNSSTLTIDREDLGVAANRLDQILTINEKL